MIYFENEILKENFNVIICGIDEVGRGFLVGLVVVCVIILNLNYNYLGFDDLKKVFVMKCLELNEVLKNEVIVFVYGIVIVEEIDEFNIYKVI